jgi:hypothetical protein
VELFESAAWHRLDALATTTTTRVAALENVHQVLDAWCPRIDSSMHAMRAELTKVSEREIGLTFSQY